MTAGNDEAGTAPTTTAEGADLGILCVHGMGQQRRGDALATPVRALHRWLAQWYATRPGGEALDLTDAQLAELQLRDGTPAHARLAVPDGGTTREWLFAESWWADDFEAPGIPNLCTWMLLRGAAVVSSHLMITILGQFTPTRLDATGRALSDFGEGLAHLGGDRTPGASKPFTWRSVLRGWMALPVLLFLSILFFVAVVLPTFILQMLTAVIMVLALIPIRAIRERIRGLLLVMRSVLGDGYQFTENSAVRVAILSHVQQDLAWLASRSRRLVVLAHSQGAAVAYRALMSLSPEERPPGGVTLITYGSGLVKLERLTGVTPLLPALIAIGTPIYLLSLGPVLASGSIVTSATLILAPLTILAYLLLTHANTSSKLARQLYRDFRSSGVGDQWLDIRSSRDPVPTPVKGVQHCAEIDNYRSVLLDHNSYWANGDVFVPAVLRVLLGPASPLEAEIADQLDSWRDRRGHRLLLLYLSRLCIALALLVSVVLHHDAAQGVHGWISGHLEGLVPSSWPGPPPWISGALVLAALAMIWYVAGFGAWLLYNGDDSRRARRAAEAKVRRGGLVLSLPFAIAIVAPVPWVIAGPAGTDVLARGTAFLLPRFLGLLHGFGWVLFCFLGFMLIAVPVITVLLRRGR